MSQMEFMVCGNEEFCEKATALLHFLDIQQITYKNLYSFKHPQTMKYANIYLGVLTTLLLASCKHNETKTTENKAQAIAVNVTKVESSQANKEVSVSGNVDGSTTVRLGFLVAGRINFISSREGQNIGKGQLVATIEPTNYKIAKDLSDVQVNQVSDEYNRLKLMRIEIVSLKVIFRK
jgi:multidrug efflux pump subunit AcrA (membrane-fusion protein)